MIISAISNLVCKKIEFLRSILFWWDFDGFFLIWTVVAIKTKIISFLFANILKILWKLSSVLPTLFYDCMIHFINWFGANFHFELFVQVRWKPLTSHPWIRNWLINAKYSYQQIQLTFKTIFYKNKRSSKIHWPAKKKNKICQCSRLAFPFSYSNIVGTLFFEPIEPNPAEWTITDRVELFHFHYVVSSVNSGFYLFVGSFLSRLCIGRM